MPCHEVITCPKCGSKFECKLGSITICDCMDVNLSKEQNAYLAEHWQSCLCPKCLVGLKESVPVTGEDYTESSVASH